MKASMCSNPVRHAVTALASMLKVLKNMNGMNDMNTNSISRCMVIPANIPNLPAIYANNLFVSYLASLPYLIVLNASSRYANAQKIKNNGIRISSIFGLIKK